MQPHGRSVPASELLTDEVRRYFSAMNTGWRVMSKDKRRLIAQMNAKQRWELRRLRYGPTGQRERSYKQWRAERGKPAIGDDGREIKP